MTDNYEHELETAKTIARAAGQMMLQYFDGDQEVEIKNDGSPVTIADKLINSMVIKSLTESFPEDGVIGEEESNTEYGMGRKWFCDPIDGTKAFTWGVPTSMFSLALVIDGKPVIGVAYDPYLDRLYSGVIGEGSHMNDKPLHVSELGLSDGIVAATSSISEIVGGISYLDALVEKNVNLATFSGAVYKSCLVGTGRFVGYIENKVNAHDMAAVQVIVESAGGKVTGMNGQPYDYSKPFRGTIVSNGAVHDELVAIVAAI